MRGILDQLAVNDKPLADLNKAEAPDNAAKLIAESALAFYKVDEAAKSMCECKPSTPRWRVWLSASILRYQRMVE